MRNDTPDRKQPPEQSWEPEEETTDLMDELRDALDTVAEVECPHCGESIAIGLDPGGGARQDYVEDCQVCCRPCRIRLQYGENGRAEVWVEATR